MSNELTVKDWSREQVDLIKSTVAVGATDLELKLFLYTAAKRGLDPLLKQIYFIKRNRWNKETGQTESVGTIQTGIDGFRLISDRTKKLSGIKRGVTREGGKLISAWAEVYRSDWNEPARVEVSFNEYKQVNKNGELMGLWATMPENQLQKCAETAAHRMAFPEDLSGIYSDDEMGQAENSEQAKISPQAETRRALAVKVNENLKTHQNDPPETNVKPRESTQNQTGGLLPIAEVHSTIPEGARDATPEGLTVHQALINAVDAGRKAKTGHKPPMNAGEFFTAVWEELKISQTPALERLKLTRTELALLTPDQLEAKFQELNK